MVGGTSVSVTSVLYVAANKLTTAANAVVLQYAMPLFVIAIDWLRDGKRPGLWDIITVLVIAAGIALCFANNLSGGRLIGNILALLSAGTYSVMFYISQNQKVDSLQFIYQGLLISSLGVLYIPFDPGFYITVRIVGRFLAAACYSEDTCFFVGYADGSFCDSCGNLIQCGTDFSPVFAWMMIGENRER